MICICVCVYPYLVLGLSDNAAQLRRMREIELKHSRIAMVAVLVWPLIELSQPTGVFGDDVSLERTIASGAFLRSFSTGVFFVGSSALEYLAFLNRRSLTRKYIEVGLLSILLYCNIIIIITLYLYLFVCLCLSPATLVSTPSTSTSCAGAVRRRSARCGPARCGTDGSPCWLCSQTILSKKQRRNLSSIHIYY